MRNYVDSPPVRVPPLLEHHLGERGWAHLHLLADLHGRAPRLEALALLRWALYRSLDGEHAELTAEQFASLLSSAELAETSAA